MCVCFRGRWLLLQCGTPLDCQSPNDFVQTLLDAGDFISYLESFDFVVNLQTRQIQTRLRYDGEYVWLVL